MKIAVLLTIGHFIYGGAEKMADTLVDNLNKHGHVAKRFDIMYSGTRLRHFNRGQLHCTLLRFDDVDMVIPLSPVCTLVEHPNVVPWLIGQSKIIYDFFDTYIGLARHGSEGKIIRDLTIAAESKALARLPRVYTISPRVKELLKEYNGINAHVLPLPLDDESGYICESYGDFMLYHSRMQAYKRQHLAVEAMLYTKSPVRLVVIGADNDLPYVEGIRNFIKDNNLSDIVDFIPESFTDEHKSKLLSTCLGGFYLGENEDYWAIVTTEYMLSKKPVIAPKDTGATNYIVKDGITGYQPEGTPQSIAEAIDKLYFDKKNSKQMGEEGYALIKKICPTWDEVVKALTEEAFVYDDCFSI
jgi:glycosyltransferase involved in cell wall biosynthesis